MGLPERGKKKHHSLKKSLRRHGDPWSTRRTKYCTLANTKGERMIVIYHPPYQGQRGRCTTARGRRQGAAAISAPEAEFSTKLWTGCLLQTKTSWDPRRFTSTSTRNVIAWDQHPKGHTPHTRDCALVANLANWAVRTREVHNVYGPTGTLHSPRTCSPEQLGLGKGTKCTALLWPYGVPKNLSVLDLGRALKAGLTSDSALTKHTGAWIVWTQEVQDDSGCGKPSEFHPRGALLTHASRICLQCPSFSTAQLSKWSMSNWLPVLPSVWGKLDTEETCKQKKPKWAKKGKPPRKWQVQHIKILKLMMRPCIWGVNTEIKDKYKPEQGTIWNWTDSTLLTSASEKFLDIFLLLSLFV